MTTLQRPILLRNKVVSQATLRVLVYLSIESSGENGGQLVTTCIEACLSHLELFMNVISLMCLIDRIETFFRQLSSSSLAIADKSTIKPTDSLRFALSLFLTSCVESRQDDQHRESAPLMTSKTMSLA